MYAVNVRTQHVLFHHQFLSARQVLTALQPPANRHAKQEETQILAELSDHGDVPRGGKEITFEFGRKEGQERGREGEELGRWWLGLGNESVSL